MTLLPATFYTNDLICLALSALAIVLVVRAVLGKPDDGYSGYLMVMLTLFALITGFGNVVFNLVVHDFAHAWRMALLTPGPFMLPVVFYAVVAIPIQISSLRKASAERRRRAHAERDKDRLLAELREMSEQHKKGRAASGE